MSCFAKPANRLCGTCVRRLLRAGANRLGRHVLLHLGNLHGLAVSLVRLDELAVTDMGLDELAVALVRHELVVMTHVLCELGARMMLHNMALVRLDQLVGLGRGGLNNNSPTYAGRAFEGHRVEGLLFNARMVQALFDDRNPETRDRWAYPDTGVWDPERNVREFLAMLPEYRRHGLLAVALNLQGGSPESYSREQPWHNSAFTPDGDLDPAYLDRLRRVLDRLDQLGMLAIVGLFYFGQDERLRDEAAVRRAVDNAVRWLLRQKA